jgi:hypothetical protein
LRRFSAISLLILLALSLLTPLFGADVEASVPACCRRNGAHHCAMGSESSSSQGPSFRGNRKCPLYSGFNLLGASAPVALHRSAIRFSVRLKTTSILRRQAEVTRVVASAREHSKRGPPSVRLFV